MVEIYNCRYFDVVEARNDEKILHNSFSKKVAESYIYIDKQRLNDLIFSTLNN